MHELQISDAVKFSILGTNASRVLFINEDIYYSDREVKYDNNSETVVLMEYLITNECYDNATES